MTVSDLPVVIRTADGNDLEGVVAVGRTAWRATYSSIFPPELLELFLDKWWTMDANVPAIRARRTVVADQGGKIVAMASYGIHQGRFVIWKIYVLPEAQGRGIGGLLLDAMYERARGEKDSVFLSFTDGNAAAYDFARLHGFVEDGREEQNGLPDLIWMRKDLVDGAKGDDAGDAGAASETARARDAGAETRDEAREGNLR